MNEIYDPYGQQALKKAYQGFVAAARDGGLPLLVTGPTWRCNHQLVQAADVPLSINRDAIRFMQGMIQELGLEMEHPVLVGGLLGPLRDAYRPELALDEKTARKTHAWQADELAQAGADYLMAATLPAVEEAAGLARAMAQTGTPYIVSFVLNRQGRILDGYSLDQAIQRIDAQSSPPPAGYMVNCSYPSFFQPQEEPARVLNRLIGYQANASSLEHCELDQAEKIEADPLDDWGDRMLELHLCWGLKILGGCCGTGEEHLRYLVSPASGKSDISFSPKRKRD
ncbi:MAG: homocysteine S-methyltransferase family protein [Desulfovermiculus sp.]|nr:homocysteine S-methyltransferase family protein [Desulfovermiculus sp.]